MMDDEYVPRFNYLDDNDNNNDYIQCDYYSPDKLIEHTHNYRNKSFSILGFNIRSCRKNFASFLLFLTTIMFNFSIIVLYETWLSDSTDYGFDIDNYNQINLYRNNLGGGIKIFYDKMLNANILDEFTHVLSFIEILTFIIKGNSFSYIVCAIYRPPSASIVEFNEFFF